jgi:hypothetical protein
MYHAAKSNIRKYKPINFGSILATNYKLSLVKAASPHFPDEVNKVVA